MPASFQKIEEPGEIGVEIGMGILQRVTDTSLPAGMHHRSEFAVAKNGLYALAIGEIDLVKTEVVEFAKNGEFRSSERSATRTQRYGGKAFRSDGCRLDQLCEHRKSQWLRKLSMAQVTADDGGQYFVEDIPPSTKSVAQFRADYKCDF